MAEQWYLRTQDDTFGPETRERLLEWARMGRIQPGQEPCPAAGKLPPDVLDPQHLTERQKLPGVWQGHVLLPLADGLVAHLKAQFRKTLRQFHLAQPLCFPTGGKDLSDLHTIPSVIS